MSDEIRTRVRTIWIRHEQDDDGTNVLVIGDDGGEFAQTFSTDLNVTWDSAKPYIESLLLPPAMPFDGFYSKLGAIASKPNDGSPGQKDEPDA